MGQDVSMLVNRAPLCGHPVPDGGQCPLKPRCAVHDEELRPAKAPVDEVVENGTPGLGRFPAHVLDGEQRLLPVLAHPNDDEERDRGRLAVEPHPDHRPVEDEAHDRLLMQRAGVPSQASVVSPPMFLTASSTFCPSSRTPMTTRSEIEVALRSSRTRTTVPSRMRRTIGSSCRERAFQASQSVFTFRHTRLTTSLPMTSANTAASARRTRRVLVPAKHVEAIKESAASVRRWQTRNGALPHS